jgi:hypothetical protein
MTAEQWIESFAGAIGLSPPDPAEVEAILELASTAAHDSERVAAPVAAWLAGVSGKSLTEINEVATGVLGSE